jgi:hypothetical protein
VTAINRPLTDDERSLLMQLAIWTIAEQTGVTDQAAADALDDLNEREGLFFCGDSKDAYITAGERHHVIVHAERDWVSFHAQHPEAIDLKKHGRWIKRGD